MARISPSDGGGLPGDSTLDASRRGPDIFPRPRPPGLGVALL